MPSYAYCKMILYSEQPVLPYVADLLSMNIQSNIAILAWFPPVAYRPDLVFSV